MSMKTSFEFKAKVGTERRITIPPEAGIKPDDFVIIKVFQVPVDLELSNPKGLVRGRRLYGPPIDRWTLLALAISVSIGLLGYWAGVVIMQFLSTI